MTQIFFKNHVLLFQCDTEEEEEHRKTSIKWADWEGGKELQQVKQGKTLPKVKTKIVI